MFRTGNMSRLDQDTVDTIRQIAIFCIENRGRCFVNWSNNTIFKYVAYQLFAGQILSYWESGRIKTIAVASRDTAENILKGSNLFDWKEPRQGDSILVGAVCGDASSLPDMMVALENKWPDCKVCRWFTMRRGKPHEITESKERFLYGRS